jgi:hypothetical protein
MRKVIATKDAAHTREKMSMVTFSGAPQFSLATFPFDRGPAQVLQQKPSALNRCRDF